MPSLTPIRRAALVVALEGGALVVLGLAYAASPLLADATSVLGTVLAGLIAAASGAGLLALARGLAAAQPWARAPVIVVQLLAVPVGVPLVQAGVIVAGVVVLVLAVAVLGLLLAPGARAAFDERA